MLRTHPARRTLPAALALAFASVPMAGLFAGTVAAADAARARVSANAPWRVQRLATLVAATRHDPAPFGTTLTVTNCNDSGPGSLRQALLDAQGSTSIQFAMACSTITLSSGALTDPNADSIRIAAPLRTVNGRPQPSITIDAAGHSRVIEHRSTGAMQLEGLALVNGRTLAINVDAKGGCVYSNGRVIASGVTIAGCVAEASENAAALGGGIWSDDAVGLVHSQVTGNVAQATASDGYSYGGGVFASSGFYAVFSTIDGNQATALGYGGGVGCRGPAAIISSSISGNSAAMGGGLGLFGGIGVESGDVYLANSTVAQNTASFFAGGIDVAAELTVHNSTIAGNNGFIAGRANGIVVEGSHPITLVSTIVHGNAILDIDSASSISGNANLVGASSVSLPAGTLNANPLLGTFDYHGGLTRSFDLQATSPAIDAGDNPLEFPCDQRGGTLVTLASFRMTGLRERVAGVRADIGAFEFGAGERLFHNGFEPPDETCYRER